MTEIDWSEFSGLNEREMDEKAKQILSMMTLREKAIQMCGDGNLVIETLKMLKRYNVTPIPAGKVERLGIYPILFSDGPRGIVMNESTCFPCSMARGATWDPDLEERIGEVIGIEARSLGANFFGGVCINLLRHPSWGRAQETYGEDPYHLGVMGSALVRGTQKHVMACAKHYACNSIENSRLKVDVKIDERTLREVYLPHFKKCVDEGVASIMTAYNKVNGEYCGHNYHLIRDILKKDWNFKGFVISDFGLGIRNGETAVKGGMDIEMPLRWRMADGKLVKMVKKGKISEAMIDDAVLRILRQKIRFAGVGNGSYERKKVACKEHVRLALEVALKSIVLLKNDNVLPLDRKKIEKIAVIGKLASKENIGDKGSSRVYPPYVITPLEGIKNSAGAIRVIHNEGKDINGARVIASRVDVAIVVVGFTSKDEGEYMWIKGGDREKLRLKEKDEKLISEVASANKNTIVILESGSAIIMENWKNKVPAILMAWYPGMEGGNAIGKIIFGDFNPCAKIPIVFPKSKSQLPFFESKTKSITYGYYHGYRLMDKHEEEPAFPFGFGLSYTTFSYDNIRLDKDVVNNEGTIKVSVDITNTGDRKEGSEIIQMYVGYENSSIDRPVKDLKGFGKLILKPNETKTLTLDIKAKDLAYYDVETSEWKIEEMEYTVHIGPSSRKEDLLTAKFLISST